MTSSSDPGRTPRPFRFGVQLRTAASANAWVELARKAEQLGYAVATLPDHIAEHLAPVPALATIAASTTVLRIGTMVLSNDWRHPVLVARDMATLDWLSNGRLEFGIGAGWMGLDYDRLGIHYDTPGVRIDRMTESLEIMKQLLSGASVTRAGRYYQLEGATCYPASVQTPHPPIVIGGGSQHILSVAGRLADIVNVHTNLGAGQRGDPNQPDLTDAATERRLGWVRKAAGDRFADIELGLRVPMAAVTDNRMSTAADLGARWKIGDEAVVQSPYALVGSVQSIVDDLLARRERFGFSYIVWNDSELTTMAPVVKALSGR
jgi:probable F420-dependent oxidoreductase